MARKQKGQEQLWPCINFLIKLNCKEEEGKKKTHQKLFDCDNTVLELGFIPFREKEAEGAEGGAPTLAMEEMAESMSSVMAQPVSSQPGWDNMPRSPKAGNLWPIMKSMLTNILKGQQERWQEQEMDLESQIMQVKIIQTKLIFEPSKKTL